MLPLLIPNGDTALQTKASKFLACKNIYLLFIIDLGLHTCYIDLESGTFVAKAAVTSFVDHYDKNAVVDQYADMYFVMFMNQIPYQLEGTGNYTKQLTKEETEQMDLGLIVLYNDLEEEEGVAPIDPHLEVEFDRNARSPCKDDRCLFLTNKQILPDIELFSYSPSVDVDISREMHDDFFSRHYHQYKYANAVDKNDQTSWKSIQSKKEEEKVIILLIFFFLYRYSCWRLHWIGFINADAYFFKIPIPRTPSLWI